MSSGTRELSISADVFSWLYYTSGCPETDVLAKTNLTPERWNRLLTASGKISLPISIINELATLYKRPITAFLIAKRPEDNPVPKDFRRAAKERRYSQKAHQNFIKAQHALRLYAEMRENIGESVSVGNFGFTLTDNPFDAARQERHHMGTAVPDAKGNADKIYKEWREYFTNRGVPVFQYNLNSDSIRGFVTKWGKYSGIVVNSGDAANGKIFTLFHEYAHILLGSDSVSTDDGFDAPHTEFSEIERWCDNFSGEFLMPESLIRANEKIQSCIRTGDYAKAAEELARTAKVSKPAALVRLRMTNVIPPDAGAEKLTKWREEVLKRKTALKIDGETPKTSGPDGASLKINELGSAYVSLTNRNYKLGKITYASFLETLGISKKSHERLQRRGLME
ncbi:MAG TPA: ImmA/IrrE family metallo-endopeptidase [Methanocorpusculum sp.]|nr:ImmA/IrrE family metallo-endopeptidase [Methanocorpusculum sp.]